MKAFAAIAFGLCLSGCTFTLGYTDQSGRTATVGWSQQDWDTLHHDGKTIRAPRIER